MKHLIIIALILTSCSTQKRCEHHTKKARELGCLTDHSDTIWHTDTIKGFSVDTVFKFSDSSAIDTVWIVSNGIKVKTVIRWKDRIVEQTITKRDTLVRTKEIVRYKNFEIPVRHTPWWIWVIIAVMGVTIVYQIFKK